MRGAAFCSGANSAGGALDLDERGGGGADGDTPPRGQAFEGLNRGLWNPLDNIDPDGIPFVEKVFVRKNGEPLPTVEQRELVHA